MKYVNSNIFGCLKFNFNTASLYTVLISGRKEFLYQKLPCRK